MEDGELDVEEGEVAVEGNAQVYGLSWLGIIVLSNSRASSLLWTITAVTKYPGRSV